VYLGSQIQKYRLEKEVGIMVSDNASTDDTWLTLVQQKKEWSGIIHLTLLKNATNVGLEQNTVNLLGESEAEYIIWLGDDDFLADGYLAFIRSQFSGNKIGWMIPGLVGMDQDGNRITGRPVDFPFKIFSSGFDTLYQLSHMAHQMSGLVVKRTGLLEAYLSKPQWCNPYLYIYFTAYCQLNYDGMYAPSFQTQINNYNPKDWGYNKIGLLDEVFKSYYYLKEEIGRKHLNRLLLRFILMHSYRINFNNGLGYLLQQGSWILKTIPEGKALQAPLFQLLIKEYLVRKFR
jgi:hypothetical protein